MSTAVIVTGHSRGLGAATATHLLARGARVLGVSRGTNAALAARFPDALREVTLDLADTSVLENWIRGGALAEFCRGASVAALVNNAGVLQPIGPLDTQETTAVARAVAVNVSAALTLCVAFVRATADVPDRRIMHISSGAATNAYAGWSVYCATKAALDQHARAVAQDDTRGLRIASVAPGVIDTDMQAEIRGATDERFPDRPRFVELKRTGKLRSPEQGGANLADLLLADEFGRDTVVDLRYAPDRARTGAAR